MWRHGPPTINGVTATDEVRGAIGAEPLGEPQSEE